MIDVPRFIEAASVNLKINTTFQSYATGLNTRFAAETFAAGSAGRRMAETLAAGPAAMTRIQSMMEKLATNPIMDQLRRQGASTAQLVSPAVAARASATAGVMRFAQIQGAGWPAPVWVTGLSAPAIAESYRHLVNVTSTPGLQRVLAGLRVRSSYEQLLSAFSAAKVSGHGIAGRDAVGSFEQLVSGSTDAQDEDRLSEDRVIVGSVAEAYSQQGSPPVSREDLDRLVAAVERLAAQRSAPRPARYGPAALPLAVFLQLFLLAAFASFYFSDRDAAEQVLELGAVVKMSFDFCHGVYLGSLQPDEEPGTGRSKEKNRRPAGRAATQ